MSSTKKIDQHIGVRIRNRRIELGITQEQLAQRIGISYQQVQKYETASNRVSASRLMMIADILLVEITFFTNGYQPDVKVIQPHGGQHRQDIELNRNFQAIKDPAVKASVAGLVRELAGRGKRSSQAA